MRDNTPTVLGGLVIQEDNTGDMLAVIGIKKSDGSKLTHVMDYHEYLKLHEAHFYNVNGYVGTGGGANSIYVHSIICDITDILGYDTVDHINRVKCDNRRKNLRPALQSEQNENRDTRNDKRAPPQELLDIGISTLPRGVRWDYSEARFTGSDIAILRDLRQATGRAYDAHGTKSARCNMLQKFASCLSAVKHALDAYATSFPDRREVAEMFNTERVQLLDSFKEIATFCHTERPAFFDAPALSVGSDDTSRMNFVEYVDFLLAEVCLVLGIPVMQAATLGGPMNQPVTLIVPVQVLDRAPEYVVRWKSDAKGERTFVVLDAKYTNVWEMVNSKGAPLVNWDAHDQRMHVYPELRDRFPLIGRILGDVSKFLLSEFVFHVLEGNPKHAGHVVVAFNQQRNDVRAANLLELPGEAKNYKAATVTPPDGMDIGMPYLPRGVSISADRSAYLFVVSTDKKHKIGFRADTAAKKFKAEVLPMLYAHHGGEEAWNSRNMMYQKITKEYFEAARDT